MARKLWKEQISQKLFVRLKKNLDQNYHLIQLPWISEFPLTSDRFSGRMRLTVLNRFSSRRNPVVTYSPCEPTG